ncbi:MAG TPA: restriction endonuclease subunit S [Polaromonas sp.]|jgi:type I restriction enzyme S subunit
MLLSNLNLLATAPGGVARLRELILTLAVQGKLVPQDPSDEPASELLKKIRAEKDRLIAKGKIKRDKPLAEIEEEEKPFGLPKGWEWVRLGDLCSYIQRGKGPVYADHSEHRVISQKCVRWYGLNLEPAKFVTAESLTKYEAIRFLQAGDLLWNSTGTGTIGRACLVPPAQDKAGLVADSHVTVVRPVQLNGWFLWRWIQSPYVQSEIEGSASGTTNQIELNTSTVINHLVPVPPVAEQPRIVTRVEELMRLCEALEAKGQLEAAQHAQLVSTLLGTLTQSETPEQLAENWHRIATHFDLLLDRPEAVDALEQTILQLAVRGLLVPQDPQDEPASELLKKIRTEKDRLIAEGEIKRDKPLPPIADEDQPFALPVGWEFVRLIDLMPEFQNGASSRGDAGGQPITVLRLADIKSRRISLADTRQIPIAAADIKKYQLVEGDILITRVNGSADIVGQFNLCDRTVDAIYCDHFIRMRIDKRWITPNFCGLLGESDLIRASIKNLFITTAGQKTVNQGHIGSLAFGLAPLAEQSRIVTRVASLRRLCVDLRQRLTASQSTQVHLAEALVQEVA